MSVVHKAYVQRVFSKCSVSCCRNGILRANAEVSSALTTWLPCCSVFNTARAHPLGSHGVHVIPRGIRYTLHPCLPTARIVGTQQTFLFQLQKNNITTFPLTVLPFPVHLKNNTHKTEIYCAWLTLWKDPSVFFKKKKNIYICMYKPTPKILKFKTALHLNNNLHHMNTFIIFMG